MFWTFAPVSHIHVRIVGQTVVGHFSPVESGFPFSEDGFAQ